MPGSLRNLGRRSDVDRDVSQPMEYEAPPLFEKGASTGHKCARGICESAVASISAPPMIARVDQHVWVTDRHTDSPQLHASQRYILSEWNSSSKSSRYRVTGGSQ